MTADAERIAELEEDNRRLRRLLDQRDAPGELRHRLRSTLALLRAIVHRSAATERDLAGYVAHLEDRIDAVARAQASADQHGEVDLGSLLAGEFLQYSTYEDGKLVLSGPDIRLQPRVGQIVALAVHELAVNAVEHGALGIDEGRVEVSWSVAGTGPDELLSLTWTEHGSTPGAGPVRHGFGTEVLTRMLAYELKAETEIVTEEGRLVCTVRIPLPEQVGRVMPT